MRDNYALQCGFCTPGVVMTLAALTAGGAKPSEEELIDGDVGPHLPLHRLPGHPPRDPPARRRAAAGEHA